MKNSVAVAELTKVFDINPIYATRVASMVNLDRLIEEAALVIAEKPKPFVKWVGGKRQLLAQFRKMKLYPPDEFNPETNKYFEPFVGGGAVFFDLLPLNAELSDLNQDLVTTYNVIKSDVEQLIDLLKTHKYEKDYFLAIRSQDSSSLNDREVAARFIYLNRTCFNGMYRVNSKGKFNVPFGRYTNPVICDEDNLRKVSKSLQNVEVKHQDYKAVLGSAKAGDFVYFDPPYYPVSKTASFTSYTSSAFLDKEQVELRDTVLELHRRGCFVMLSNSDVPFIREIYSKQDGIRVNSVSAGRSINSKGSGRGKISEVLVTNY